MRRSLKLIASHFQGIPYLQKKERTYNQSISESLRTIGITYSRASHLRHSHTGGEK